VKAARANRTIWTGINMLKGVVTDEAVAKVFKLKYAPLDTVLPRK